MAGKAEEGYTGLPGEEQSMEDSRISLDESSDAMPLTGGGGTDGGERLALPSVAGVPVPLFVFLSFVVCRSVWLPGCLPACRRCVALSV